MRLFKSDNQLITETELTIINKYRTKNSQQTQLLSCLKHAHYRQGYKLTL